MLVWRVLARVLALSSSGAPFPCAEQVQEECSGDYKSFLNSMLGTPTEVDAQWLFNAMDGMGTTEEILTEIIVNRSNDELAAIKEFFEGKYDRPLIDMVGSETSGDYEKFMIACLQAERDEGDETDEDQAAEQAEALHKAGKGFGCDESVFIDILSKASVAQCDLIQAAFEAEQGKSLKAYIKSEMGGELESAMCLRLENRLDSMCTLLFKAMDGMGTDEGAIARVLGGSTKDVVQCVVARYDEKYSGNLVGQLKDECSGSVETAIMKWLKPVRLHSRSPASLS